MGRPSVDETKLTVWRLGTGGRNQSFVAVHDQRGYTPFRETLRVEPVPASDFVVVSRFGPNGWHELCRFEVRGYSDSEAPVLAERAWRLVHWSDGR
jgi:hypothetical protein